VPHICQRSRKESDVALSGHHRISRLDVEMNLGETIVRDKVWQYDP
jgi:hypothetical protein